MKNYPNPEFLAVPAMLFCLPVRADEYGQGASSLSLTVVILSGLVLLLSVAVAMLFFRKGRLESRRAGEFVRFDDMQKQADLEAGQLQESLAFMSDVLGSAVDIVMWVDISSARLGYINQAGCLALGYSQEQLLGMTLMDIDRELTAERWRNYVEILNSGAPLFFETDFKDTHANVFPVEMSMQVRQMGSQQLVILFARDISARKQDEQRMRYSEERISAILDSAADAIVVIDENFSIDTFSMAAESTFGYEAAEITGQSLLQLISERERDDLKAFLDYEDDSGSQGVMRGATEFTGVHKSGQAFPMEISVNRVNIDDEDILVCIMRDVSERHAIGEQLSRAQQQAEAGLRSKSNFLANMSHEIRTPMNAIIGMTQLVLENEKDEKNATFLTKVLDASYVLLEIMSDVLDFSRIDAGKITLDSMPFSLPELLLDIKNKVDKKSAIKNLVVGLQLPDNFPGSVIGDPARLKQVLMHLCDNAIKFTPDNGHIDISLQLLEVDMDSRLIGFTVRDTGIGIAADRLSDLFKDFEQLDASITRQFGGTGLGLAISRKLVEMMGGSISVDSKEGKGSEFSFSIRLKINHGMQGNVKVNSDKVEKMKEKSKGFAGASVLLLEEGDSNRQQLAAALRRYDLLVTEADSADEAIRLSSEKQFDAVVVDCQLPGIDGCEFIVRLRGIGNLQHKPLLGMTADADESHHQQLRDAGLQAVLLKPLHVDDMVQAFNNLLERKEVAAKAPLDKTAASDGSADLGLLKHIDVEDALKRSRHNMRLFNKLLNIFYDRELDFAIRFNEAYAAGRMEDATREAHSLKGVAGNLSAQMLQEKAYALELACRDGNGDIPALLTELSDELKRVLDGVHAYNQMQQRAEAAQPGVDIKRVREQLNVLRSYIVEDNVKAVDLAGELSRQLQTSEYADNVSRLLKNLQNYDFDSAKIELDKLESLLPG